MKTPVLSKEQQRRSLSSAKKGPIKGLRNVLAVPYERFWPEVKIENQLNNLEAALKKSLIPLKHTTPKIPWKQLRKMSKEKRSEAREKIKNHGNAPDENKTKNIVTGINAVTRSLEKKNLCSIVLDSTVEPPFMIKHLISMSVDENIPVILAPFLKKLTLETMDFASAAIGFTKSVKDSQEKNNFSEAHKVIEDIYKNIPKPKRASQSFQGKVPDVNSSPMNLYFAKKKTDDEKIQAKESVHKYRSCTKERAFVPPTSENSVMEVEDSAQINDFIGLGDYDEFENVKVDTQKRYVESSYAPLKVKRLRGNPNRVKAGKIKK